MEYDFRTTLMILSAIAIFAILLHGLWKIRKNKNPYKFKAPKESIHRSDEVDRNYDGSGFDQDGVSQPRVVNNDVESTQPTESQIEDYNSGVSINDSTDRQEPSFDTPIQGVSEQIAKPVYEAPVSSPKPVVLKKVEEPIVPKKVNIDPEVLVLSVLMPNNQLMSGAALLPTLLTLGMKYGEMNIFHRHEDNAGNGKVTFSLASMMNPGTFDLDNMENFTTQGISLFMSLPSPSDGFKVFEQMLSAAKELSQEFNAQLLDDKRNIMTKQTEQHYVGRIRDFERKYRIASS